MKNNRHKQNQTPFTRAAVTITSSTLDAQSCTSPQWWHASKIVSNCPTCHQELALYYQRVVNGGLF
jgi:hypothetical protein